MAPDKLNQLGKRIGRFQHDARLTSRYVAKNHPSIEESTDMLGPLYKYTLEFKMYNGGTAYLSIKVFQKFKTL